MDKETRLRALFDGTGDIPDDVHRCVSVPACDGEKSFVHDLNPPNDASRKALARIMIVGEAPGSQENKKKLPFVGPSGKVIEQELAKIGISRDDIYFSNVVRCWPTDGGKTRPPTDAEVAACFPVLQKEIEIIQPLAVIATGGPSIKALLGKTSVQGAIKGGPVKTLGTTVIPTYHPAAAMHSPGQKTTIMAAIEQAFAVALSLTRKKPMKASSLLDFTKKA